MQKLLLWIGFLCVLSWANAQQLSPSVISSAGETSKGESISLDWTLGETAIQTFRTSNGVLTEGFHQPLLKVEEATTSGPHYEGGDGSAFSEQVKVGIAPNPVTSSLRLQVESDLEGQFQIDLLDQWGRPLQQLQGNFPVETRELDMSAYPASIYILRIREQEGALIKVFKVTKVNY